MIGPEHNMVKWSVSTIFHGMTGSSHSIDLSGNLCEVMPCSTADYPVKAARPHYSVLDKTKVKETFSIAIPYWKDSLRYCLSKINF